MKGRFLGAAVAAAVIASAAPAAAQDREYSYERDDRWRGDRDSDWDPARAYQGDDRRENRRERREARRERRLAQEDRVYRGSDGRYYCKRSDGTTGLVVGGVAGGLLGNVIGGGTLGTLLGAGGGALLGRKIERDRDPARCR